MAYRKLTWAELRAQLHLDHWDEEDCGDCYEPAWCYCYLCWPDEDLDFDYDYREWREQRLLDAIQLWLERGLLCVVGIKSHDAE